MESDDIPEFPPSLPVEELEIQNAEYNPVKLTISEALYRGGDEFEAVKDRLLLPRRLEKEATGGRSLREARLRSAHYGAPVAGFIDFLAACVFHSTPTVLFEGPEDKVEYYNAINNNLPAALNSRLIQLILHGRAFMSFAEKMNMTEEPEPECIGLDASAITDWERDDEGKLVFLKTCSVDLVRTKPWLPPDRQRYTWTFFCREDIYEYEAYREVDSKGKPRPWKKGQMGTLVKGDPEPGLSAITEIALPNKFCLMDSIKPLVIGMFNREASLDYALDNSAYSFLLFKTKKAMTKVMVSEMNALVLDPTDDAKWLSPEGIVYEALRLRGEDMRKALENRIQSAALNLSGRDMGGRASGAAKFRDFGPIAILLEFYGSVLRAGLKEHIEKLITLRGDQDEITFTVHGLDEFDIQSLESKMTLITQFLALPAGLTAKKWALGDLEQSMLASAPPKVREVAKQEALNNEQLVPAPAVPDKSADEEEVDGESENKQELKEYLNDGVPPKGNELVIEE